MTRSFIIIGFFFTTTAACDSTMPQDEQHDYLTTLEDYEGASYYDPYDQGWYSFLSGGEYREYDEGSCSLLVSNYVVTLEEGLSTEIGNSQGAVLKVEGEDAVFWMAVGSPNAYIFYEYPTHEAYADNDWDDVWQRYEKELCE